ncbi:MAG: glycerophosphodiester phosphodiesterase family protein [Pseudomonadota bacterium]
MLKVIVRGFVGVAVGIVAVVWGLNASVFAPKPAGEAKFIAHRGVHQTYHRQGLDSQTCTAERIDPPRHPLLENTIPSMAAAFEAGADVVEIDVHLTTDDRFAVFHDWTLDCRTEGTGRTRDFSMADLKALDIGYGYTADGGETYPFRGRGVGLMPSLSDVLNAFPDGRFLVNFKSDDRADGAAFAEFIAADPARRTQIWGVYGSAGPTEAVQAAIPGMRGYSRRSFKACALDYLKIGWTGRVPETCRDTVIAVPVSHARPVWGWPYRFLDRMEGAGTTVILAGEMQDTLGLPAIDDPETLARVPDGFGGYVWTDRIEIVGPAAR